MNPTAGNHFLKTNGIEQRGNEASLRLGTGAPLTWHRIQPLANVLAWHLTSRFLSPRRIMSGCLRIGMRNGVFP